MVVTTGDYRTVVTGDVRTKDTCNPDTGKVHEVTWKNVPELLVDEKDHSDGTGWCVPWLHSKHGHTLSEDGAFDVPYAKE